MKSAKKVWLITGASEGGIGNAIMNAALNAGDCVVATLRKGELKIAQEHKQRVLQVFLDVSNKNENAYKNVVDSAMAQFGRIDILVNNAGFGGVTNFEETKQESIYKIFEVNFFGALRVTRAVLPIMRQQKSGHIFNIASGAGYTAGPVPYHSSKFALTGFSVSLAFEVAPFGIKVTNVAPGLFRTNFYQSEKWGITPEILIKDYDAHRWQESFVENALKNEQPGDPAKLADLIVQVANVSNPPLHLPIGEDAISGVEDSISKIQSDIKAWKSKAMQTQFD